jgi:hypothetical protein
MVDFVEWLPRTTIPLPSGRPASCRKHFSVPCKQNETRWPTNLYSWRCDMAQQVREVRATEIRTFGVYGRRL